MAAARYWRVTGMAPASGTDIEVAGAQLWASGARVDASAAVSANMAPTVGATANLQSTAGQTVRWAPGNRVLAWLWDFGTSTTVDDIYVRNTADEDSSPLSLTLEYSDDASSWTRLHQLEGLPYAGAGSWINLTDKFASQVVLLLDGEDNRVVDRSLSPRRISSNTASIAPSAASRFGNGALSFNGTNAVVGIAASADFYLSGDFTIESWVCMNSWANNYATILANGNSLFIPTSTFFMVYGATTTVPGKAAFGSYATNPLVLSQTQLTVGTYYHVAVSRQGATVRLFVNGVLEASASSTEIFDFSLNGTLVGRNAWDGANGWFSGYLDELRVTQGVARYTAAFVPAQFQRRRTRRPYVRNTIQAYGTGPTAATTLNLSKRPLAFDMEDFGFGTVSGVVQRKNTPSNVPLARRVRLHHQVSGRVVREAWSDAATGTYAFNNVAKGVPYYVLAFDYEGNFRGVVADNILAA